ncbi:MAG: dihydrofolate reductase, partial [Halobacteriota archaeon]
SIVDRLGHALDGRTNIVLSTRDPDDVVDEAHRPDDATEVLVVDSLDAAVDVAELAGATTAYVIGGASVYEQFLPLADRLHITEVPGRYGGDTTFPELDDSRWEEASRERAGELRFVTYRRRDGR